MKKEDYKIDPEAESLDMIKAEKLLQKIHKDLTKFDCSIRLDMLCSLMDAVFIEVKVATTKTEYKDIFKQIMKHLRETNK